MTENRQIVGTLENIHLLRKLFVIKVSKSSPLHFSQMAIMNTIEHGENCTQADIAKQLGVTPASVATSTKRLQRAGLITKTVDEENLRCKRLSLTDEGRAAINSHKSIFSEYDELVFKDFSDGEKEQLLAYLTRILEKMQDIEGIEESFGSSMELTCHLHNKVDALKEKNN